MGMLLLGIGIYVGILAAVWMVSSAYASGGIWGIIGLIAWVIICMWIACKLSNKKK